MIVKLSDICDAARESRHGYTDLDPCTQQNLQLENLLCEDDGLDELLETFSGFQKWFSNLPKRRKSLRT